MKQVKYLKMNNYCISLYWYKYSGVTSSLFVLYSSNILSFLTICQISQKENYYYKDNINYMRSVLTNN